MTLPARLHHQHPNRVHNQEMLLSAVGSDLLDDDAAGQVVNVAEP
jgi:hypothetical protein